MTAIVLDPRSLDGLRRYGGRKGGVFKSTDGGTSWQGDKSGLIAALAIDPARPTTLYAATDPGGVFRSTDAGKSWRSFDAGLTDRNVTAFALDPTGRTVYAATGGGGVVSLRRNP